MERKSERKYKNLLSTTFWDSEESLNRSPNVLLGHGKTCYLSQGYWSQGYLLVQHPIVKVDHRGGIRTAKLLSRFKMAASMVSFCSMVEDNFRGVGLLYSLHTYFFFQVEIKIIWFLEHVSLSASSLEIAWSVQKLYRNSNQMESVGEIYLQLYRNLMCKHRLGFEVNRLVFRVGKDHL